MTMGPFASLPTIPEPCSFLQPMEAASTHKRSFAGTRRMVGSVQGKAALLSTPVEGDQPACRQGSRIVGSTRARPTHSRRRRQPRAAHLAVFVVRGGGLPGPDGGARTD